jgi:hypothetical protein
MVTMRLVLCAAAFAVAVSTGPAVASAGCATLSCVNATIGGSTGTCGSPSTVPYPHQHCQWRYTWSVTGTAITPGAAGWSVTPPDSEVHGTYSGGCTWTLPGGCTTTGDSGWQVAAVPCGGTRTIVAYIDAYATTVNERAAASDSSTLVLYAPPC